MSRNRKSSNVIRIALLVGLIMWPAGGFSQASPQASLAELQSKQPLALTVKVGKKFQFVAYGDLREAPKSNTKATEPVRRQVLIDAIAAAKPAFVEVSGDLVLQGDKEENWQQWHSETAMLRQTGFHIFPALGNHELIRDPAKGLENYFRFFPELEQNRYYSVRAGSTKTLVLDSALDEVSGAQGEWLQREFETLPTEIEFVFILVHHPPYTRSVGRAAGGGHGTRPREVALAEWLEQQQKTIRAKIVVVAGHVHNYERYSHRGVTYIVSGGGGASPYEIPRDPTDAYRHPGPAYSYCLFKVSRHRLSLEMKRLDMIQERPVWTTGDSLTLTVR